MCSMLSSAKARPTPACAGAGSGSVATRLWGNEVMTASVGVERGEQPMLADHLLQAAKARGGAFLDQKDRVDRACCSSSVTIRSRGAWPASHACGEPS